ncbi:TetR family transcriptional regulator [Streptomyces sp. NPDC049906]|uniref:TetR/AcrR family transcriptional regulator n=1 Tax=Streptomyces sp. NPDC049906 TaxID=3155656 RepID=UPI00344A1917
MTSGDVPDAQEQRVTVPEAVVREATARPEPEPVPEARPEAERETKGQRTRRRILEASRRQFAQCGYERATIRSIAADAGVDKASVIHYFGTKQELFREAVAWQIPIAEMTTDDPRESVGNYLRNMLDNWSKDPETPMTALLRASMTSEEAAELLRGRVTAQAVDPVAERLGDDPDARLKSALVGAMMMGVATHRHILRMPDLAEADLADVLRLAVPVLSELITPESTAGPVPEPDPESEPEPEP